MNDKLQGLNWHLKSGSLQDAQEAQRLLPKMSWKLVALQCYTHHLIKLAKSPQILVVSICDPLIVHRRQADMLGGHVLQRAGTIVCLALTRLPRVFRPLLNAQQMDRQSKARRCKIPAPLFESVLAAM